MTYVNKKYRKSKMTSKKASDTKLLIFLIVFSLISQVAFAQYEIRKHTINSGGGVMSGGSYEINGSFGQVDVNDKQTGGNYTLQSGYWHENNDLIFKNAVE